MEVLGVSTDTENQIICELYHERVGRKRYRECRGHYRRPKISVYKEDNGYLVLVVL